MKLMGTQHLLGAADATTAFAAKNRKLSETTRMEAHVWRAHGLMELADIAEARADIGDKLSELWETDAEQVRAYALALARAVDSIAKAKGGET